MAIDLTNQTMDSLGGFTCDFPWDFVGIYDISSSVMKRGWEIPELAVEV